MATILAHSRDFGSERVLDHGVPLALAEDAIVVVVFFDREFSL